MSTPHPNDRPLPEVLKSLFEDLGRLVRGEIALLKAEMRENVSKLGTGAGLFGGAGIAGWFALQFTLLALMFGLVALGLQAWLAALLVAMVLGIVAAVLAMRGKKAVGSASIAPVETVEQLKTDAAMIKNDVERIGSR